MFSRLFCRLSRYHQIRLGPSVRCTALDWTHFGHTHTLLEFLAPITHPRLSGEMWLKSVPYEKEPQPLFYLLFKLVRETQA